MKICFFNRSYHPDLGATGQLLTELAEDLAQKHGCQVSVVAGPPVTADAAAVASLPLPRIPFTFRRQRQGGAEILRAWGTSFRPARFAGRAANYLSYFLSAFAAGADAGKPDIVIFLTDPPIIGLAALWVARRAGAKRVFLCQDVFPEVAGLLEGFRSPAVNRLLEWISRFLIRKSDRVIAIGETMKERLIGEKGAAPGKIRIIHNWADCTAVTPQPKKNPFSLSHGLSDRFVVMHSGNMGLSQDLDILLDAAEHLRDHPDILLVMAGDGVRRQALEERARRMGLPNIRFLPYQPREKLAEMFSSADLFIVSLKQGLSGYIVPSKLYGILAAGRPYVAAVEEQSDVARITRRYECGLLAAAGDPKDLAERILILYNDPGLARRMGENARKAAMDFDRPKGVRAYYEMCCELTGKR